jgi:hypothetical protein
VEWQQREVLSRLSGGWTMEQVSEDDRILEAKMMRNRVGPHSEPYGHDLLSLRDPDGFPQVNVLSVDSWVVQVLGRGNSRVSNPEHLALLREHFGSLPKKTWYCPVAGLREDPDDVPDEHGIYGGPQIPYYCMSGWKLGGPGQDGRSIRWECCGGAIVCTCE